MSAGPGLGARALRSFFEFELWAGSKVRDIKLERDTAFKKAFGFL